MLEWATPVVEERVIHFLPRFTDDLDLFAGRHARRRNEPGAGGNAPDRRARRDPRDQRVRTPQHDADSAQTFRFLPQGIQRCAESSEHVCGITTEFAVERREKELGEPIIDRVLKSDRVGCTFSNESGGNPRRRIEGIDRHQGGSIRGPGEDTCDLFRVEVLGTPVAPG